MAVEVVGLRIQILQHDAAVEDPLLPFLVRGLLRLELGHDLLREHLQTVADVLMAGLARLIEQDDLIDV